MLRRFMGKGNGKCSALAFFTENADFSSMLFNNPVDDGESQPRTLADFFGCEKRVENFSDMFFRYAGPCILDLKTEYIVFILFTCRYCNVAAVLHCLRGVEEAYTCPIRLERILAKLNETASA